MEEHELGAREDLTEKVNFVLADPLWDVGRDRNTLHESYRVFDWTNMKHMANVRGDVMIPEAYRHLFRSAVQFALRYRALG